MKDVDKALADQKVSGRRMVIEEVEGSDDDEEPASAAEQASTNSVESSDVHAQEVVTNTDDDQTCEAPTDKTKDQDSQVSYILGGGDADAPATAAGNQTQSVSAEGDTASATVAGSQTQSVSVQGDAASADDNLPPAVLTLKDAGNTLFRQGQYGDALDKYNAAVQLLGHCYTMYYSSCCMQNFVCSFMSVMIFYYTCIFLTYSNTNSVLVSEASCNVFSIFYNVVK